jgi:hypothetical protein
MLQNPEEKFRYNEGLCCPFCSHENINSLGGFNPMNLSVSEDMSCNNCNKLWTVVYEMTTITYEEDR